MIQKPKALAACNAVLELLNENVDINAMTVSQVAERAGVGKGTLYDYFSSKEDMVVSAIAYEVQRVADFLEELVGRQETTRQKINLIFDCMEENAGKNNALCRFVRLSNRTFSMGNALQEEMERRKDEFGGLYGVLEQLCKDAAREGLIAETVPAQLQIMTLASKFLMFLMYLENENEKEKMQSQLVKRYLYEGLLADWMISF